MNKQKIFAQMEAVRVGAGLAGTLLLVMLAACKDPKPEPTCMETVTVSIRNGQRVVQAINGLHLKADFPISNCASKPYSEDPYKRNFVVGGGAHFYWSNGRLFDSQEYGALFAAGKGMPGTMYAVIDLGIGFDETPTSTRGGNKDWWYEPAIPHKRYPIDLLPNFGLDAPDPQAGVGPVKSTPAVYWAVRGSQSPKTKQPYTTHCGMNPPPNNARGGDVSYQRDVSWLIQGETSSKEYVGDTCRGGVRADNGVALYARIDVPGMAVADIDKIYQAVSKRLSEMTVE